ncbi:hypothetical protein M433DRAFT_510420 [Acidomyces richmondensis BFW]|nr:MAG: hypothetical protein FE78DRAFT_143111 [Acidomyces sp. 'richmondensis']KYG47223.1 hypothetical protein M433DRAFT_510420 [Acidomyces richmondensis BFW]
MEGRNQVFQLLKPQCIALSQTALALNGTQGNLEDVTENLENLRQSLAKITSQPGALDTKLADYIFFPVSQVFKVSQKVSIRCLELSLQILAILVDEGWRQMLQPQLAAQIVILCTLLADGHPKGFSFSETTDELQTAAFWCLHHVFSAVSQSEEGKNILTNEANFPQLGQTISVLLDGINDSDSPGTQIAATSALQEFVENVASRDICAGFLPGIVSKLTKVLVPTAKKRRSPRVLIGGLDILTAILKRALCDEDKIRQMQGSHETSSIMDAKWKETAATQLKPALTSIMRLKAHNREDVKEAIMRLCLMLLDQCRKTLASCSTLAVETLVSLSACQPPESTIRIQTEILMNANSPMAEILQTTIYDWLRSLPTIMQGADDHAKVNMFQQISTAYSLLEITGAETGVLDRILASSLHESTVTLLQSPLERRERSTFVSPMHSLDYDLDMTTRSKGNTDFGPALVLHRGQESVMASIEQFTKLICRSSTSDAFVNELARSLQFSQDEAKLSTFWLLLVSVETLQRKDNLSDFLNIADDSKGFFNDYLEELYSLSLSILAENTSDEPNDSRLQALALRTLALKAQSVGKDFRYELIDALYPVLHTMATPNEWLQADSMTTLNVFTVECSYGSVQDLIVKNVDYLTNAVSLRLNAFDISPQAPQVLLMMVRLAGPSLLPYLEDTVESIFAALEDYHGYPLLVELLFKVLGVMAEEGVRAPQLTIKGAETAAKVRTLLKESWRPMTLDDLAGLVREWAASDIEELQPRERTQEPAPHRPWKKIAEVDDSDEEAHQSDEEEALGHQEQPMAVEEQLPPAPKTYNLLLKITELTQHFLPSASPSLRASLLSLIRTTVPAIAKHEDSFLPLINTLWPEIVSRLDDREPHIQATALELIGILCQYAGDFMRTRIQELWPIIVSTYRNIARDMAMESHARSVSTKEQTRQNKTNTALIPAGQGFLRAIKRMEAAPAEYFDTSTRIVWNSLIDMLTWIVRSVQLPPELFDDALEMLTPVLDRHEIRQALEEENADAVWLALLRSGAIHAPEHPIVPADSGWKYADIPG